ncbi:SDR family oxidoreductase [Ferroplasma sp.]|uniref:SDR family NAD(P)-dependent oxidoreductase n=1 Tax=Ferroplasma sp. TaxID=2591003 RepID=UPI00307E0BFF
MTSNIVIAGVGKGIGSSLAYYLNSKDYNLFLISRGKNVENVAKDINCNFYHADFNAYSQCNNAMEAAEKDLGTIDAVVNVAGNYYSNQSIENTEPENFEEALLNNARSFYNIAKSSVSAMKKNKHGSIIGFSAASNVYLNSNPGYSAGKGAVYFMVKSLARELIHYNIRVNGIAPGFIGHDMSNDSAIPELGTLTPFPTLGINQTVEFLINNEMITGEIIPVSGGHDINLKSGI